MSGKGTIWRVKVQDWKQVNGKLTKVMKNVGFFEDEVEAARAYDAACLKFVGEKKARLNFPKEGQMVIFRNASFFLEGTTEKKME